MTHSKQQVPDHVRISQLEDRVRLLEAERDDLTKQLRLLVTESVEGVRDACYAVNHLTRRVQRQSQTALPVVPADPDLTAAQFLLQYDYTDQSAFLESGVPRAAADLVAASMGLLEKQEFFKRVVTLAETAAHARLSSSLTGFGFWFSVLTSTAHLLQQAGHEIYSPADVRILSYARTLSSHHSFLSQLYLCSLRRLTPFISSLALLSLAFTPPTPR